MGVIKKASITVFSVLLIVGIVIGVVMHGNKSSSTPVTSNAASTSTSSKTVDAICEPTQHKDACVSSMQSVKPDASLKDYIEAAVKATIVEVKKALNATEKVVVDKQDDPFNDKDGLDSCKDFLEQTIEQLDQAISEVGKIDMNTIEERTHEFVAWLTGANIYIQTCVTELGKPELKSLIQNGTLSANQLVENALYIFSKIKDVMGTLEIAETFSDFLNVKDTTSTTSSAARRLLNEDTEFPSWVSNGDRKLLGFSDAVVAASNAAVDKLLGVSNAAIDTVFGSSPAPATPTPATPAAPATPAPATPAAPATSAAPVVVPPKVTPPVQAAPSTVAPTVTPAPVTVAPTVIPAPAAAIPPASVIPAAAVPAPTVTPAPVTVAPTVTPAPAAAIPPASVVPAAAVPAVSAAPVAAVSAAPAAAVTAAPVAPATALPTTPVGPAEDAPIPAVTAAAPVAVAAPIPMAAPVDVPGAGRITPNVIVAQDGSGTFKTITEAVNLVPLKNPTRFIIYIKSGIYNEVINVRKQHNLFLVGDGIGKTIITGNNSNLKGFKTSASATVGVDADFFMARGLTIENTAGVDGHQAVALRVNGEKAVLFECEIKSHQDTLYYHKGLQFYKNCIISGTVDFMFGTGRALIQESIIIARQPGPAQANMITADGGLTPVGLHGLVIQNCRIIAEPGLMANKNVFPTYLGRPWRAYASTIFIQNDIEDFIVPAGYSIFATVGPDAQNQVNAVYREYMNTGAGANNAARDLVNFPKFKILNAQEAEAFTVANFIQGAAWLPAAGVPFKAGL